MTFGIIASAKVASGGSSPPTVVATTGNSLTATLDCAAIFSSYTPALNDFILIVPSSQSTLAVVDVAGWTNAGGSGAEVNASSATGMAAIYHWVDAGEVSGVAQTYTATGFFGAGSETGYVHAFAVRGVNTSTPIDDFSMLADIALGASHLTPALTGSNLSTGSTVLAGLGRDGASGSGYGTQNPTGWTQLLSTAVNNDRWSGILNTATTTGVGVASASLTPVVADEYISWAIALNKI